MEKITGEITNIIFCGKKDGTISDSDYYIFRVIDENGFSYSCEGRSQGLNVGTRVILEGTLVNKSRFGETFVVERLFYETDTIDGKRSFLSLVLSKSILKKVLDFYNDDCEKILDVLKNNPSDFGQIKGIKDKTIEKIESKFLQLHSLELLYPYLSQYDFNETECRTIYKKYGVQSLDIVKDNPYVLCRYLKFNFQKIDSFAKKTFYDLSNKRRQIAVFVFLVRNELKKGHCYALYDELINDAYKLLAYNFKISKEELKETLSLCEEDGVFVIENNQDVYFKLVNEQKKNLERFVLRSKKNSIPREDHEIDELIKEYEEMKGKELKCNYKLGKNQKEAVKNSVKNRISIITGGPGTGKTTVLECVLYIAKALENLKNEDILLMAPTGKAAKRMRETTKMNAFTIHTALGSDPKSIDNDTTTVFKYNKNQKLEEKFIVVDESSMLDYSLASSLIDAIKIFSFVVFVGDINQLPPVSYGYTLRDLIDSGVPCVKLWEVKRQSGDSTIIPLSNAIQRKKLVDNFYKQDRIVSKFDFGFLPIGKTSKNDLSGKNEEVVKKIVDRYEKGYEKMLAEKNTQPLDDIVVLSPVNKGTLGVKNLNNEIQKRIFEKKIGTGIICNSIEFMEGTKVLQTKNNKKRGIVNGETGYVVYVNKNVNVFEVEFESGAVVRYDDENRDEILELSLGYAMTIHKSQGSEWKFVIEIVSSCQKEMNTKSLVYTGITRTKEKLLIIGDIESFLSCSYRLGSPRRSKIL